MPRKEQPRDPHTGQWAKEYVFDLADTRISERPKVRPDRSRANRFFSESNDKANKT